ncbi:MAG: NADH-quinone oxidoreductase subunit J [Myxococcota bacterium]
MTGPNFTLFIVSSLIAIAGAVSTVVARRPLRAAMGLLVHIIALAGLYLTLSAHLLAAIQVLVYAGAIVVLFVFVIMLIGPLSEQTKPAGGTLARIVSLAIMAMVTGTVAFSLVHAGGQWVGAPNDFGTVEGVGMDLYTIGLVPFELISITLTVAIVGAIALAKGRSAREIAQAKAVREAVLAQQKAGE